MPRNRASAIHAIVEALRRNDRLPHALLLGIITAALFGSLTWLALSHGMDVLAYIDQHGREKTMEQMDSITGRVWRAPG